MTHNAVLIDPHYFPCVEYFARILPFKKIVLEVNEHYVKQTYRNRCHVQIANKIQLLTVPVEKVSGKMAMKEIKIAYHQAWQKQHWKTISSAYGQAPFFDFFAPALHDILCRKYEFLVDLNIALLTKCLDLLEMGGKQLTLTEKYTELPDSQFLDVRNKIGPRKKLPDDGFFLPLPYYQVFGKDFVPNLSVIDLLFSEGSRAGYVINRSISCER